MSRVTAITTAAAWHHAQARLGSSPSTRLVSQLMRCEELPDAVAVMDPFHVIRPAGDAVDQCRRRVQQALHGHRGRAADPLYRARRTLHTGTDLLTEKQKDRLAALFAAEEHLAVEVTWTIYQAMITAYREPDRAHGHTLLHKVIVTLGAGVPTALTELRRLGRTLTQRASDILAYFDRPDTSNGPNRSDQRPPR